MTPTPPAVEPGTRPRFRPWRSARLGWSAAVLALIAGLPLFLRMPPWCDLTLYDVAARNVLTGGVHYRDVFDTNPPGFVLALAGIRTAFGWSVEAVRAVDLLIVAATIALLAKWVRLAGGTPAGIAWMAAGAAAFYPFASEFNHAQRDVWMMLPVVAAGWWRVRNRAADDPRSGTANGGPTAYFLQGFLLGLAAWLKPHALVPAAAVWLTTLPPSRKAIARDFLGNLLGGLTALGLGVAWLVGSGAWPAFLEVFAFWNPGYLSMVVRELPVRWPNQFVYFPPWSLFQPVAVVLATVSLVRRRNPSPPPPLRGEGRMPSPPSLLGKGAGGLGDSRARTALAALFLAWTAQALFLQRGFQYAHVPETLFMLAVFAAHVYAAGFVGIVLAAVASALVWAADGSPALRERLDRLTEAVPILGRSVALHSLADPARMTRWPACWRIDLTAREYAERRNAVGLQVNAFNGIDWVQLGEVADYLAAQNPPPADGEVIAWHDSPHALYLLLNVRPGFRFMHVSTVTGIGEPQYCRLRDELHAAAPRARWVVADLRRVFDANYPEDAAAMAAPGPTPADPPPAVRGWFPKLAVQFPFDQQPAFRSANGRGRYVVFRLVKPVTGECRIPRGLGVDLE